MNIKEVETSAGVAKQNIRYYEKEGLLKPKRNQENGYREYEAEDIETLKKIRVLRKVGMPIEDIRKVLEGTLELKSAVQKQTEQIQREKLDLEAALAICQELEPATIQNLDADRYLNQIEQEEKKGNRFFDILEDYKKISKAEGQKIFSFLPDNIIESPEEFTTELLHYANQNHDDIVITKESMYPEFELNGIEYTAHREHHRYGPIVCCEAVHPEELEPAEIPSGRKKWLKRIRWAIPYVLVFGFLFLITNSWIVLIAGGLFMIFGACRGTIFDLM